MHEKSHQSTLWPFQWFQYLKRYQTNICRKLQKVHTAIECILKNVLHYGLGSLLSPFVCGQINLQSMCNQQTISLKSKGIKISIRFHIIDQLLISKVSKGATENIHVLADIAPYLNTQTIQCHTKLFYFLGRRLVSTTTIPFQWLFVFDCLWNQFFVLFILK